MSGMIHGSLAYLLQRGCMPMVASIVCRGATCPFTAPVLALLQQSTQKDAG